MTPMAVSNQKGRSRLLSSPQLRSAAISAIPTGKIGKTRCTDTGFNAMIVKFENHRFDFDVVNTRRGAKISKAAIKAKALIKNPSRKIVSSTI